MNKLNDIMQHYHLKEDDQVVPNVPLPESEQAQILQKTLAKAGLETADAPTADTSRAAGALTPAAKHRGRRHSRKSWTLGIACVLVLAMATVSFASAVLDKSFLGFFQIGETNQQELLAEMISNVNAEVTDNGVTLRVKQIAGDSNSAYVLFDLIAPEGTVLDKDYYPYRQAFVDLTNGSPQGGYYFELVPDDDPTDNQISMILSYESDSKLAGKTMHLHLEDLMTQKSEEELTAIEELPPMTEPGTVGDAYDTNKVLLPGVWDLEFPLDYQDASRQFKPKDRDIELYGETCKIKEVRYSPISATITITGDAIRKADEVGNVDDDAAGTEQNEIIITLKDGSTVENKSTQVSTDVSFFGGRYVTSCQFDTIINPNDIASISYADVTIPVN